MRDREIVELARRLVAALAAPTASDVGDPPADGCPAPPPDADGLTDLLAEALTPLVGERPVPDADGDIGLRLAHTVLYVRPGQAGPTPLVRLFAPLLAEVEPTAALLGRLNELNASCRLSRVFHTGGGVLLAAELPAEQLAAERLREFVRGLAAAADALAVELRGEGIGMYL